MIKGNAFYGHWWCYLFKQLLNAEKLHTNFKLDFRFHLRSVVTVYCTLGTCTHILRAILFILILVMFISLTLCFFLSTMQNNIGVNNILWRITCFHFMLPVYISCLFTHRAYKQTITEMHIERREKNTNINMVSLLGHTQSNCNKIQILFEMLFLFFHLFCLNFFFFVQHVCCYYCDC